MAEPQRPRLTVASNTCTIWDEHGRHVSLPRYRHTRIPVGRTIRLLKLQMQRPPWPLSRQSEMNEFSLVRYELDNTDVANLDVSNSPYVAMSYSWGEPIFDAPLIIIVDGQRTVLPVTASAWEAVQRTVPAIEKRGLAMWIDQICINQDDRQEKEQQVELMGDIYRRCWHCMIWLGPEDNGTAAAFALLNRLEETFSHRQPIEVFERQIADLSHARIRADLVSKYGRDVLPPVTDPGWVQIARLLQRDWFTRLWTFQEAVLCYKGDATIRCGLHHIPVITFMRAAIFLGNEHVFAGIKFTNERAALHQISVFRYHLEHRALTPMIWLLQNNCSRECTVAQDRVYALLSLRNEDGPEFPIEVSYRKSPEVVYTEVARKIIHLQASLRICADAPERVEGGQLSRLPSWVPDWTRKPLTNAFEKLNPTASYFKASNGRTHSECIRDPTVLLAAGKAVDSITTIIDTEIPDALPEKDRREVLIDQVLPLLLAYLRSTAPGRDDADLAHTIVNTITVGGYTRDMNLGNSGLPDHAWSKTVCGAMLSRILSGNHTSTDPSPGIDPEQWLYALTRQALQCTNRRFAILENNLMALVPAASEPGNLIVILHGSSLPFVLKKAGDGAYKLIGSCYVDKIMFGEAVNWVRGDQFQIR